MSSVIISLCKKPSLVLGNNFAEDTGLTRAPDDCTLNNSMCKKKSSEKIKFPPIIYTS